MLRHQHRYSGTPDTDRLVYSKQKARKVWFPFRAGPEERHEIPRKSGKHNKKRQFAINPNEYATDKWREAMASRLVVIDQQKYPELR
jgi:hypothetical protein